MEKISVMKIWEDSQHQAESDPGTCASSASSSQVSVGLAAQLESPGKNSPPEEKALSSLIRGRAHTMEGSQRDLGRAS